MAFDKKAWSKAYAQRPDIKERWRQNRIKHPEKNSARTNAYAKTPYGKFMHQRKSSVHTRGIKWELTFEEWFKIWQDSGHWEERGSSGYQMCRYGDEGAYTKDNVYIAYHVENKKHAVQNGKCPPPPRNRIFTNPLFKEQFLQLTPCIAIKELSKLYGVSEIWARKLRRKFRNEQNNSSRG